MKPETEGKLLVAFIISLIAFGVGSGAGIMIGISGNNTSITPQVNNSTSDNPQKYVTPKTTTKKNTKPQQPNNNNSETVYIDNNKNNGNQNKDNNNQDTNKTK